MEKNSFILYIDQKEIIDQLSDEEAGKLFKAIYQYNYNKDIIIDGMLKVIFTQFKIFFDKDEKKWQEEKNKRREAGKLGGITRALNKNQNLSSTSKQCLEVLSTSKQCLEVLSNGKQTQANQADNVNVNDNVNDNVNVNVNDNDNDNDTIYDYVQKNFGRTLKPIEYEEISKWEDNELTRHAIKQAVLNNAYSFRYIETILNNYKVKGIQTIEQARIEDESFKKQKEQKQKYQGLSFREQELLRQEEITKQWLEEG